MKSLRGCAISCSLLKGKFVLYATYGTSGILTSPAFACISVDMELLFKSIIKHPEE